MKVNYENGELHIDLHELLCGVTTEKKMELIESLACDDEVIEFVSQQIINKWTENSYSGGSFVTASVTPSHGLDRAWREVSKRAGDVAKREVERLEAALLTREKQIESLHAELRLIENNGRRFT